jgi:hypothetical protein
MGGPGAGGGVDPPASNKTKNAGQSAAQSTPRISVHLMQNLLPTCCHGPRPAAACCCLLLPAAACCCLLLPAGP